MSRWNNSWIKCKIISHRLHPECKNSTDTRCRQDVYPRMSNHTEWMILFTSNKCIFLLFKLKCNILLLIWNVHNQLFFCLCWNTSFFKDRAAHIRIYIWVKCLRTQVPGIIPPPPPLFVPTSRRVSTFFQMFPSKKCSRGLATIASSLLDLLLLWILALEGKKHLESLQDFLF